MTLKCLKDIGGKRIVEIICDPDLTCQQTQFTRLGPLGQRHQASQRAPRFGDNDLLTGGRAFDQGRQIRLRLIEVDGVHIEALDQGWST